MSACKHVPNTTYYDIPSEHYTYNLHVIMIIIIKNLRVTICHTF